MAAVQDWHSDQSSIISISERMAPSDTEDGYFSSPRASTLFQTRVPTNGSLGLRIRTPGDVDPDGTAHKPVSNGAVTPRHTASPPIDWNSPRGSDSDFASSGVSHPGSICSLSRVSFSSRLSQLKAVKLPNAAALSSRLSSILTAPAAATALTETAEQIKRWTSKASHVLGDLDAADDVEWAAAGGRDGLDDVDQAITRFGSLVKVYVLSVEGLQTRRDSADLSSRELATVKVQMASIVKDWQRIKESLQGIKQQVEIAMEWEELWNTVLGEIRAEAEALSGLVFEMEERRHLPEGAAHLSNVDINELEHIVEDKPAGRRVAASPHFSLSPPYSPSSPKRSPPSTGKGDKEDSNLLALFARMQPLRASLDFLPMRLSVFHCRGNSIFPSACIDLERRRDVLEGFWKKLDADAEALRRELGEDRWVLVFRNAGRQALKMCESVERSHNKLKGALDHETEWNDTASVAKMIESYEAKKTHYAPAVERVLAIIDRGVMDRLTVNGEILRLQWEMRRTWSSIQAAMRDLDMRLDDMNTSTRDQKLRDSISTILSSERSMTSSMIDTPASSPASSIFLRSRESSINGRSTPIESSTIQSSTPRTWISSIPRRPLFNKDKSAILDSPRSVSSPLPRVVEPYKDAPPPLFREFYDPSDKPRFTVATSTSTLAAVRALAPQPATDLAPQRKPAVPSRIVTPRSRPSMNRPGSSMNARRSLSPVQDSPSTPSTRHASFSRILSTTPGRPSSSFANRTVSSSASLATQKSRMPASPLAQGSGTPSTARKYSLRAVLSTQDGDDADTEGTNASSRRLPSRPPSAMAASTGRRSSIIGRPQTRAAFGRRESGLEALKTPEEKPSWRF